MSATPDGRVTVTVEEMQTIIAERRHLHEEPPEPEWEVDEDYEGGHPASPACEDDDA